MSKKNFNNKSVPIGIKIISILFYVGAALYFILGILSFIGTSFMGALPDLALTPGILIILGIVLIIISALSFIIGFYLWKLKRWARIVAIILSILGIISSVYSLIQAGSIAMNIISLIIDLGILVYLIFDKKVISAFR